LPKSRLAFAGSAEFQQIPPETEAGARLDHTSYGGEDGKPKRKRFSRDIALQLNPRQGKGAEEE